MAISKSTNQDIIQFSIELKKEQQLLLEDVNKLANNNLIIITELNSNDVKKNRSNIIVSQETNFEEQYIDYLFFALDQELKFLEEIILQTQDVDIKNFVNDAIPKQEEFIEQMHNFKNETIYKQL
jgi:predicted outer membrane protein